VARKGGSAQLAGLRAFCVMLASRGFEVAFRHNILYETQGWQDSSFETYDRIIVAIARAPHSPFGPLQLYDDEAQTVWAINALPKGKTIVVSFGSPYLCDEYFERVDTCINAWSNVLPMHEAVTDALTGCAEIPGSSPVQTRATMWPHRSRNSSCVTR
jgi:beta-N-acetylhexosaminidase